MSVGKMDGLRPKSYHKIGDERMEIVIQEIFGKEARLLSWESSYFTKKGENFLGKVKEIQCKISLNGKPTSVSYIVKVNPRRPLEVFQKMTHSFFMKEGRYLTEVAPALNNILCKANYLPLNVPECFYANLTLNEEIILLKDLRQENFKMFDKMLPLDINHLKLVTEELAKQHAASYIFKLQNGGKNLEDSFPFMRELWLDENNDGASQYISYWKMRISSCIQLLQEIGKFPDALDLLLKNKDSIFNMFLLQSSTCDDKFQVVLHGDCWTNNLMFKYDDSGTPVSAVLLDFQQCKIGSLVTDLHFLLITTTTAEIRRNYLDEILQFFYKIFCDICSITAGHVPFTIEELKTEFKSKVVFGMCAGIILLPLLLNINVDDISDFNSMDAERLKRFMEHEKNNLSKLIATDERFRERFFGILETSSDYGLF